MDSFGYASFVLAHYAKKLSFPDKFIWEAHHIVTLDDNPNHRWEVPMFGWLTGKLRSPNNDIWVSEVKKRREHLLNKSRPGEIELFLSRLKNQEFPTIHHLGDDEPFINYEREDEAWRQKLHARRKAIFSQKKSEDDIWDDYEEFEGIITEEIRTTEEMLGVKC